MADIQERPRRKQKGSKEMKSSASSKERVHPPDKKKFERDTAAITSRIKELEAKVKLANSFHPGSVIAGELAKLMAEVTELEKSRESVVAEVRKVEGTVQELGTEVNKKKEEARREYAGVRHKTEEKIDEAVGKLEQQLLTRQFSGSEERKLQSEISTLKRSKDKLRVYTELKLEVDAKRTEQEQLRQRRDSLYRSKLEIRNKETIVRDRIAELKKEQDEARERRKEALAEKDSLAKQIDDLYKQRKKLHEEFKQEQARYLSATKKERDEDLLKREEDRRAVKEARKSRSIRHALEVAMQKEHQFEEVKSICRALISHLEKQITVPANEGASPSTSSTNLDVSETTPPLVAGGNTTTQKPGEFLRRDERGDVFVGTGHTSSRRKSKRRNAPSNKKSLNYNPTIFGQFSTLGMTPPISHSDIPHTLTLLREKLTFYESKSRPVVIGAYSEAGDSGVGASVLDANEYDVSMATSQEDLTLSDIASPRRSLTDQEVGGTGNKSCLPPKRTLTDDSDLKKTTMLSSRLSPPEGMVRNESSPGLSTTSSSSNSSSCVAIATATNVTDE